MFDICVMLFFNQFIFVLTAYFACRNNIKYSAFFLALAIIYISLSYKILMDCL